MSNEKKPGRFNLDEDQPEEQAEAQETGEEQEEPEEEQPQSPRRPVTREEAAAEINRRDPSYHSSPENFRRDSENLVDFLKFPRNKQELADFLEATYKQYEHENVDRAMQKAKYEHQSELDGSTPFHKPGHIGPLMYEYLNMIGVENAYVSGLQHTKSSMTKTVQQRVDEINTLLRGVGGFNRQIKASFSRSAVIYLEQEDPRNAHRERVIFTINLSDNELKFPLAEKGSNTALDDGRTARRYGWDQAVNGLAEIVSNTGMKPKYVRNDKNSLDFVMNQYLLGEMDEQPDEYFSFRMQYVDEETRQKLVDEYTMHIAEYDKQISKLDHKTHSMITGHKSKEFFVEQLNIVEHDKEFYIGTTPDPREMDTGIVFSILANTMKDYNITKDKMQVIMTKFILSLSKIAVDKSMDEQVNTEFDVKKVERHAKTTAQKGQSSGKGGGNDRRTVIMKDDLKKWKVS